MWVGQAALKPLSVRPEACRASSSSRSACAFRERGAETGFSWLHESCHSGFTLIAFRNYSINGTPSVLGYFISLPWNLMGTSHDPHTAHTAFRKIVNGSMD